MNENDLKIIIQKNYPMFLTNDMTLYAIINKIVEYTNKLIDRSNQLANIFNQLQEDTNGKISNLTTQVNEFITNTTNDLNNFKNTINNELNLLETNINNTITQKTSEVNTALENLDVPQQIEDYFNTLINNEYFTNLFNSRFGNVYNLVEYGSKPGSVTNFGYCYAQNILYYGIDDKWTVVEIDKNGLYLFNNQIYVPINNNGNWILEVLA